MSRSEKSFRPSRLHLPFFVIAALTGLLALGSLAGCGKRAQDPNQLVVGMELSFQPFEMLDEKGQPAGIGVDLARELAASLHMELKIVNTPFQGLIPALKTGRIDLIISSMTVNEERKQSIDFSDPYVAAGIGILANAKSDIHGIGDVDRAGRTVVTKSATTGYDYAQSHFKQASIRVLGEPVTCALEVSQGKADAFLYDSISVYQLNRKYPETTRAILEPFQREDWAIGIAKGHDELRQQVNAFLRDFKARKGIEKLNEKYLQGDKDAFKAMGFPFAS